MEYLFDEKQLEDSDEMMREYNLKEPNTYQYASMRLKSSIEIASLFL